MSTEKSDNASLRPDIDSHSIPTPPVPVAEVEIVDEIRINLPVVANIVKMAALEIDGVYSVGGGFADGIWETLGGKKGERGVEVTIDEVGNYEIKLHVEMRFGVELAKIARVVQSHVREQVQRMTDNGVSKIDVMIDGVRMEPSTASKETKLEPWSHHTD